MAYFWLNWSGVVCIAIAAVCVGIAEVQAQEDGVAGNDTKTDESESTKTDESESTKTDESESSREDGATGSMMAVDERERLFNELDKITDSTTAEYDTFIRPLFNNDPDLPINITVDFYVQEIFKIDVKQMEFSLRMAFRQRWKDTRLTLKGQTNTLFLGPSYVEKIWRPDTYFENERHSILHKQTVPNVLLSLSPGGEVVYSQRVTLRLACTFNIERFPFDSQTCPLRILSYHYDSHDLVYQFLHKEIEDRDHPIDDFLEKKPQLPEYIMGKVRAINCDSRYTFSEIYSCKGLEFDFQRGLSHYILRYFIPTMVLVNLSFVSFWTDHRLVKVRLINGLYPILIIMNFNNVIQESLPDVSYMKSIDVWMLGCMLLTLLAFVEFIFARFIAKYWQMMDFIKRKRLLNRDKRIMAITAKFMMPSTPKSRAAAAWKRIARKALAADDIDEMEETPLESSAFESGLESGFETDKEEEEPFDSDDDLADDCCDKFAKCLRWPCRWRVQGEWKDVEKGSEDDGSGDEANKPATCVEKIKACCACKCRLWCAKVDTSSLNLLRITADEYREYTKQMVYNAYDRVRTHRWTKELWRLLKEPFKHELRGKHLDRVSRYIFPSAFLYFIIYVFINYYLESRWEDNAESRSHVQFLCHQFC